MIRFEGVKMQIAGRIFIGLACFWIFLLLLLSMVKNIIICVIYTYFNVNNVLALRLATAHCQCTAVRCPSFHWPPLLHPHLISTRYHNFDSRRTRHRSNNRWAHKTTAAQLQAARRFALVPCVTIINSTCCLVGVEKKWMKWGEFEGMLSSWL